MTLEAVVAMATAVVIVLYLGLCYYVRPRRAPRAR